MTDAQKTTPPCLTGGGEMGALMRTFDWSATPLGSVRGWSQSLQTSLSICLNSQFPIVIYWGRDLTLLYNDAWKPYLGTQKHPQALGQPCHEVWAEVWHVVAPQFEQVLSTGEAVGSKDFLLLLERNGYTEEAYFTYSYSPILEETGQIGGVFNVVTETTHQVLSERRMQTIRELATQMGAAKSVEQACCNALQTLTNNLTDIPFALLYRFEQGQSILCGGTSTCEDFRQFLENSAADFSRVETIDHLPQRFAALPSPWTVPTQQAIVLPIHTVGQDHPVGMLVAGVNPCRELDEDYRSFFSLVAGHISTAIATATAHEEELKLSQLRQDMIEHEQRLRQEAEAAQRKVSTILESMTDAFIALDTEWRITYVNREVERINGLDRAQITGKTYWEMWSWSVGTLVEQEYRRSLADQIPVHFEVFYEPMELWLEIHAYPSPEGLGIYFRDITERVRVEDERDRNEATIRENQRFIQQIADTNPGVLYLFDLIEQQTLYINQQGIESLGYLPAQIQAMGTQFPAQIMHPDDLVKLSAHTDRIQTLQDGETIELEYRMRHVNGEWRWFWSQDTIFRRRADGVPSQLLGTALDITERKHTEEALRKSEEQFRLIIESAKDYAIFTLNLNGDVTCWNSGAQNLLGYSEAEILGKSGRIIFTPEDKDRGQAERELHLALTQGRAENERWHVCKDNSRFWASGLVMPLRDDAGRIQGFVKIMRDRTEARQAEAALKKSEERLRFALEASHMVAWEWSAEDNQVAYSTTVREVFGLLPDQHPRSREEALALIHPEDLAHYRTIVHQAAIGDGTYISQFRLIRPDNGAIVWLEDRGSVVCDAGKVIKVSGIVMDVSDRLRVEAERVQLLQREQAARAEAERANRVKDEFLAVLSHELRTPLNPILGWSKLLQIRKFDESKTIAALATIERNARHQAQLVEDLLDVSRVLRGNLSLNATPVQLESVILAAIETVQLAAEAKAIDLNFSHSVHTPKTNPTKVQNSNTVMGDASRLQQVFWNLLSNAVKFTSANGQVEVRLETRSEFAQITVADTGKGITPDFLPHVFDYFRQADSATTRQFGGLGLGLAIVRQIVELHGGIVTATSPGAGQGTTFTVQLPLLKSVAETVQDIPPPLPPSSLPLSNLKILVVDDEPDSREFIAFVLEQAGAEVTAVESADSALQVLAQSPQNVLISDIGMSEMDGYMLMRQIRLDSRSASQPGNSCLKAIALTAYAGESDRQQALSAGFQHHLSKPIDPDQLVKLIAS